MANKLSSAVSGFIRTVFNKEQELRQQLSIADHRITPANRFALSQLPGVDAELFGFIGDSLGLDRRRLYRYTDYEQMDEYPDISSALDIYADNATQTDSTTRKSVWIECQNDKVRTDLDDMFYRRLRIGENVWEIARQLCILEGSLVWTKDGPVPIEKVKPGDMVQAYGGDGKQKFVPVKKVWCTGEKDVWRIATRHRELLATDNHPVLVQHGDGSVGWVKVRDLVMRRHPGGAIDLKNTSKLLISTFINGPLNVPSWEELIGEINWSRSGTPNEIVLPDVMTERFARLMGFLWGDGFMGNAELENSNTAIVFSLGEDEDQNEFYEDCFRSFGLNPTRSDKIGASIVNSVRFKDVMLRLGWKNGASSKRIPSWLGKMPWGHRKAFLDGFIDADGWTTQQSTWTRPAIHFEIANIEMAHSLKALIDSLGFRSGHLRIRTREPGFKIKDRVVKTTQPTAMLTYSEYQYDPGFIGERLNNIERFGVGRVWDIEVDDDCHNFVVDGVVVHNCKYGNEFDEIVAGNMGVVGLNYLPTATMHRIEVPGGITKGFVQSFSTDIQIDHKTTERFQFKDGGTRDPNGDAILFEDWRVVHWRLRSKNRDSVYGWAVTEPARWVWKRLKLLEDAVMVYKLTRSPSRYVFAIDVTGLGAQQAERKLQEARQRLKKRKFINPGTGKPDFRYSPLAMDEDYFVGVRDGKEQTRIDTLNGPSYQQVEDVQYFLNKLYAALKVPKAYLGYDENMPSKATLSQEDVRFAMTVLRIQNELRNGLHKIGRVHLAAKNIDPASVAFTIAMTVPSAIFELGQMEVRRARAELATQMERHVSLYWLLSNVYALSDDEITKIMKQKEEETKKAQSMGGAGGFESMSFNRTPSINERELFRGSREDEKRVEEVVKRAIESQSNQMGIRLRQTEYFIRELLHALQNRIAA